MESTSAVVGNGGLVIQNMTLNNAGGTILAAGLDDATAARALELFRDSLTAAGDPRTLRVDASGHGPRNNDFALALHGRPLRAGKAVVGAEAQLQRLLLAASNQRWQTQGAATLRADPDGRAGAAEFALRGLRLASGRQSLAIDGQYLPRQRAIHAQVHVQHLDAKRLIALWQPAPAPQIPATDITVRGLAW